MKTIVATAMAVSMLGLMFAPLSAASVVYPGVTPIGQPPTVTPIRTAFVARLNGAAAGTESTAIGQALFVLSSDKMTMNFALLVSNIRDVTMAHIHVNLPYSSGAVVVWLYPSAPPLRVIPGLFTGVLAYGTFTAANFVGPLAGMTMVDLVGYITPGRTYVNVHTLLYPAGEISGMIMQAR